MNDIKDIKISNKDNLLPPGQYGIEKQWPVLTVGGNPKVDLNTWTLKIDGLVENPIELTLDQLKDLEISSQNIDFHCVTTWSMLDTPWRGISWDTIEKLVKPLPSVQYVLQYSKDNNNYTTGTLLSELQHPDVIIGFEHEGQSIPVEHGGPLRIINPHMYAYKSAKWLHRLEFLEKRKLGYWEVRGYSEQADPWKEQRYTEDDNLS